MRKRIGYEKGAFMDTIKSLPAIICMYLMLISVSGCAPGGNGVRLSEEESRLMAYTSDISGIQIPGSVRVVALGESTHGTKEYHTMRKEVFAYLVEKYGCRTFLLEASFGGCLKVNQYILGGSEPASAGEAVQSLEYWIYQTKEFKELIEWMRDYNREAAEDEKLHFYGVDMQESAYAREHLLTYIRPIFPDKAQEYETLLSDLKEPPNVYQGKEPDPAVRESLDEIREEMEQAEEQYLENSSRYDYRIALECVKAMKEFVTKLSYDVIDPEENPEEYYVKRIEFRDSSMAARVETLLDIEQSDIVFLTGHNMHLIRHSAVREGVPAAKVMGEYLSERLGDAYFAIGTAFCEGAFKAVDYGTGKVSEFYVKEEHPLIKLFANLPGKEWYLNLSDIKEEDSLMEYVEGSYRILNVGAVYSKDPETEEAVRYPVILNEEWNGMLIYKNTNPTIIRTRF